MVAMAGDKKGDWVIGEEGWKCWDLENARSRSLSFALPVATCHTQFPHDNGSTKCK